MNLIEESFKRIYPNRKFDYHCEEHYSLQLSDFNANIRYNNSFGKKHIKIKYNLKWKSIDNEIKIGLIQSLLLKVFKPRNYEKDYSKLNIGLYNNFVKRIHEFSEAENVDPVLEKSFNRVNEQFFDNSMDKPNLVWGRDSTRKLASYNYHNDTVTVSKVFCGIEEININMLDYLMYHELLHKHLKFRHNGSRNSFHNKQFKDAEKLYPNQKQLEKEINSHIRGYKIKQGLAKGNERLGFSNVKTNHISKTKNKNKFKDGLLRFFGK